MYQTAATAMPGLIIGDTNQFSISGVTPRPAQVEEQATALGVNARDLNMIVSQLEGKLVSVTQPRPDRTQPNLKTPEPVLVPLAGKLKDVCADVRSSVDRLRELCASIELSE